MNGVPSRITNSKPIKKIEQKLNKNIKDKKKLLTKWNKKKQNEKELAHTNRKIQLHRYIKKYNTWSKAGPITGTINPWYMKSSSCCFIKSCATCTTALQNSKEFMNNVSSGISVTSSGVIRFQSTELISNVFGRREYKPPSPVTNSGHIDEYCAIYVPTLEFFCDSDIHNSRASRAWWPNVPSRWTYGISSENIMKLKRNLKGKK